MDGSNKQRNNFFIIGNPFSLLVMRMCCVYTISEGDSNPSYMFDLNDQEIILSKKSDFP